MKAKLTNNFGLKTASVLLAFLIWLLVVNVSNPEVTRTQEVVLEITNESVLLDADRTYTLGRKTVAVSYDIHTLDEYKIHPSDFRAYLDLSELYDVTGSVEVKVDVTNNSNLLRNVTAKPRVVRIETEEIQTKEFKLVAHTTGRPADGFSVGRIGMEPDSITVKGPMSQVGLINAVGIDVNVNQIYDPVSGRATPVFYDANGNALNLDSRVETNIDEVFYSASVVNVRQLPLSFEVSGKAATGYQYTECTANVESVAVGGDELVLGETDSILIPGTVLNVDGASEDKSVSLDIRPYLPNGITLEYRQNPIIDVTIHVKPLESKNVTLLESDITLSGTHPDTYYMISPSRQVVTVHGLDEKLRGIRGSDLGARVDVQDLGYGVHSVSLEFQNEDDLAVLEPVTVQIEISDRLMGPGSRDGEQKENGDSEKKAESQSEQDETKRMQTAEESGSGQ